MELIIEPGKYNLVRSGFYSGSSYRGFKSKAEGIIELTQKYVIDAEDSMLPEVELLGLPEGFSPIIDNFNAKVKSGKIQEGSQLHVNLYSEKHLKTDLMWAEAQIKSLQAKVQRIKSELEKFKL